jgi:2-keto-3-deoxy-L-fuconate dehydrogenase
MQSEFSNKTAIITGGASGIGLAMVKKFSDAGAKVHVLEINIEAASLNIMNSGLSVQNISLHECNVAHQKQVDQVVEKISAAGKIDILINNAGIAHIGTAETTTESDFDKLVQVNIKGVYNCLHAVIPEMKKNGGGVILNIASIAATLGISERFVYSMTKGAVYTMTLSVAKDFLKDNIRCNSISPARIHTPFIDGYLSKNYPGREPEMFEKLSKTQPIGRMGRPDEVAALALFLCSDQAGFITGTDYPIDGGFIKLSGN